MKRLRQGLPAFGVAAPDTSADGGSKNERKSKMT